MSAQRNVELLKEYLDALQRSDKAKMVSMLAKAAAAPQRV